MFPVVEIGPLTFSTHDIFTLLGLAAGFTLYWRALRRDRILGPQIVIISLAALLVVGDHAGAKPRRDRFNDNYQWTLGWGLVPPGATYENTVDNRAWQ